MPKDSTMPSKPNPKTAPKTTAEPKAKKIYKAEEKVDLASFSDEALLEYGYEQIDEQQWDKATVAFRTLLDRDADHPLGQLGMADVALSRGMYDAAEIFARKALAQDPENPAILHSLIKASTIIGITLIRNNQLDQAAEKLTSALDLLVGDRDNQEMLGGAFGEMARALQPLDAQKALEAARLAAALFPEDGRLRNILEALLETNDGHSQLTDYTMAVEEDGLPERLLLTAMPGVSHLYLRAVVQSLTGMQDAPICYSYWSSEQDLHLPHLTANLRTATFSQHTTLASAPNLRLITAFKMRLIIMTSELPMAIAAYDDAVANGLRIDPALAEIAQLPIEQRLDLTLKLRAPWLLQFKHGWKKAVKDYELNPLWLNAELLLGVADQKPIIDAICRHFELEVEESTKKAIIESCQELFDAERLKLAKFYSHRLTDEQQAWVDSLKVCFPED
jgi:tetratricopeptide (TPR) repeat protein